MSEESTIRVVGAALIEYGRVLLTRRGPAMTMPGKWEFPGGKVEPGEGEHEALRREIREELDLEIVVREAIGRGESRRGGRHIQLAVYRVERRSGTVRLAEHAAYGWFAADEIDALDWPEADVPILPALGEHLRAASEALYEGEPRP